MRDLSALPEDLLPEADRVIFESHFPEAGSLSHLEVSKLSPADQVQAIRDRIAPVLRASELIGNEYEIITEDLVIGLQDLITAFQEVLQIGEGFRVCEVAAGTGRIAHFLRQRLNDRNLNLIATDSFSWRIFETIDVLRLANAEAIEKTQPDLVYCSWMPDGTNFTPEWRSHPHVKGYIIIGRHEDCGTAADTWLNQMDNPGTVNQPEIEGFKRILINGEVYGPGIKSLNSLRSVYSNLALFIRKEYWPDMAKHPNLQKHLHHLPDDLKTS